MLLDTVIWLAGRECYHTGHVLRKSISIKKLKKPAPLFVMLSERNIYKKKQTTFSGRENVLRITLYDRPCRYFMYYFLAFSYEILHHETRRQRRKIEGRLLSQEAMEGLTKEKRAFPFHCLSGVPFHLQNFFLPQSSIMFFPSWSVYTFMFHVKLACWFNGNDLMLEVKRNKKASI